MIAAAPDSPASHRFRRPWILPLALAIAATLAVLLAILATSLAASGGRPVAQLDDSYIHLQYARSLAQGHAMRYNPSDPPTSGATSLLYPLLLAPAFRLGADGDSVVWWSWALGGTAYLALVVCAFALARVYLAELPRADWLALAVAVLVLTNGAVVWATLSGMETVIAAAVAVAAVLGIATGRPALAAGAAGLAALTRPEGALLALAVVVWLLVEAREARAAGRRWAGLVTLSGLALAAVVAQPAINAAATGATTPTGMVAKSWLSNVPPYPGPIARSVLGYWAKIWLDLTLGVPRMIAVPLLIPVAIVDLAWRVRRAWRGTGDAEPPGATGPARRGRRGFDRRWSDRDRAAGLALVWLVLASLAAATLQTGTWHYARYQLGVIAVGTVFGGVAIARLAGGWPTRRGRSLGWAALAVLMIASLATTRHALRSVADSVRVTLDQQLRMGEWLRENTPATARIGVHDAGAIRYFGGRDLYDVIGLTTPGAAVAWRNGPGSAYEALERSPWRPDWFAAYPDVQPFSYFTSMRLFGQLLATFPVTRTATDVIVSAGEQRIYRADWSLAGSGDQPGQADVLARLGGLDLVDALDVADLESERQHAYRWWNRRRLPGYASEVKELAYRAPPRATVVDGGRLLTGGEEMALAARPHEPGWLVLRTDARNGAGLAVSVNGRAAGIWHYSQVAGEWQDSVFPIPADLVDTDRLRLRIEADAEAPGFLQHGAYHYWLYQGRPSTPPPVPGRSLHARFGEQIDLVGFDFDATTVAAGRPLTVTLYWRATAPITDAYKVFVHLAGADGTVLAQSDGIPSYDTRGTDTWQPGEIIADVRRLDVPADLPAGTYPLLAGLYAVAPPNARLPVRQDGGHGEDYVKLASARIE